MYKQKKTIYTYHLIIMNYKYYGYILQILINIKYVDVIKAKYLKLLLFVKIKIKCWNNILNNKKHIIEYKNKDKNS